MQDCTENARLNPGALVKIPVPVQAPYNYMVFAIVKRVVGMNVTLDVTVDPMCKLNPNLFSSPEIVMPAMMVA